MPYATETTGGIRQEECNYPCWILARPKSNQKVSERPEQIDLITLALLRSTSKWKTLSSIYWTDTCAHTQVCSKRTFQHELKIQEAEDIPSVPAWILPLIQDSLRYTGI